MSAKGKAKAKAKVNDCAHEQTKLVDYDPAFHDGRVICANPKCKKFIRWWDAG